MAEPDLDASNELACEAVPSTAAGALASRTKTGFSCVCSFCGKRGIKPGGLQHHLRIQHKGESGMLEALLPLLPSGEAARAVALGAKPRIAWEDDWLAILVKPQGVPTQGSGGSFQQADWLLGQLTASRAVDSLGLPRPVHRLDSGTGGLVVFAKTSSAVLRLSALFERRRVRKRYRAMVHGRLKPGDTGIFEEPVDGKPASTRYTVVGEAVLIGSNAIDIAAAENDDDHWVSTVDLWPLTGRRHQLRKHMASMGHPIIGDKRYGGWNLDGNAAGTVTNESGPTDIGSDVDSCDSDAPNLGNTGLGRSFHLWALEVELPHPAHPQSTAAGGPDPALDGVSRQSSSPGQAPKKFTIIVKGANWENFRQLHFGEASKKAKKKRKFSNVVGATVESATPEISEGDLLVSIQVSEMPSCSGEDSADGDIGAAGACNSSHSYPLTCALDDIPAADTNLAAILTTLNPREDSDVILTFIRSPTTVLACIDEPDNYLGLRARAVVARS